MPDLQKRIIDLTEITDITEDMYMMLDQSSVGARKYNLKRMYDKVDSSSSAATSAANAAKAATAQAIEARDSASEATAAAVALIADSASQLETALDAIGDISELAVPLMSPTTRGGAKLGHGLTIEDGALGIGEVTDPTDAGPIVELTAKGHAEQDTTTGKNLLPNTATSKTINGVTFTVNADGSVKASGTSSSDALLALGSTQLQAGAYVLSWLSGIDSSTAEINVHDGSSIVARTHLNNGIFTLSEQKNVSVRFVVRNGKSIDTTIYPQLEAGSTATSYEPYSGGAPSPSPSYPQEIRRVTGRNLLDTSTSTGLYVSNDKIYQGAVETVFSYIVPCERNTDYTLTHQGGNRTRVDGTTSLPASGVSSTSIHNSVATSVTFNSGANDYLLILLGSNSAPTWAQLEAGSIAHPYVPHGCVGVDVTHDGTTTTIPIPLPSCGWVAALPDGTADTLTLDGAGGYVWTLNVKENVYDGSENWSKGNGFTYTAKPSDCAAIGDGSASVNKLMMDRFNVSYSQQEGAVYASGANLLFWCGDSYNPSSAADAKSWATSNPITLLYPLATPTTESGYVSDMPTVPVHAAISSDLHDLTVRCCADEGAAEIAAAWGRRYESRIANLESIVAELVAGA